MKLTEGDIVRAAEYVRDNMKTFNDLPIYDPSQDQPISHYSDVDGSGNVVFDDWFHGIRPGAITLIGGASGVGKTSVALSLAIYQARKGKNVLYISTEMSDLDISSKLKDVPNKEELADTFNAIYLGDKTASELEAIIYCITLINIDIVYFDYLNAATLNYGTDKIPQDQICCVFLQSIRDLIQETKVRQHYYFFTQLNRLSKTQEPDAAVLQGSYSLVHKCDYALNMIRPSEKMRQLLQKDGEQPITLALYVYKNRWDDKMGLIGSYVDFKKHTFESGHTVEYDKIDWNDIYGKRIQKN